MCSEIDLGMIESKNQYKYMDEVYLCPSLNLKNPLIGWLE